MWLRSIYHGHRLDLSVVYTRIPEHKSSSIKSISGSRCPISTSISSYPQCRKTVLRTTRRVYDIRRYSQLIVLFIFLIIFGEKVRKLNALKNIQHKRRNFTRFNFHRVSGVANELLPSSYYSESMWKCIFYVNYFELFIVIIIIVYYFSLNNSYKKWRNIPTVDTVICGPYATLQIYNVINVVWL